MTLNFYVHKDDDAVECNIYCKQKYKDQIIKIQEKAEKYDNLVFIFEQYDGGLHKYIDDLFCGRLPESKVYEHLKKININGLISNYLHQSPELTKQFEEIQKSLGEGK